MAIRLVKASGTKITREYGLFLPDSGRWFLNEALVEDYKSIFFSLASNQSIWLMPKELVDISFLCLNLKTTVKCGLEQSLFQVVKHVLSIFSKEKSNFFSGTEWSISGPSGELPPTMLVSELIEFGRIFAIRRSSKKVPESDKLLSIFNYGIQNALARDPIGTQFPSFLTHLFRVIENNASHEGIFRVPGLQSYIEQISHQIDETNNKEEIKKLIESLKPHDATGLLKLYLKSMPDPLIPYQFYQILEKTVKLPASNDRKMVIKQILNSFPEPNFHIMGRLVKCLHAVLHEKSKNKMNLQSIAICIASIILKNPDSSADPITTQNTSKEITSDLILNGGFYFRNEEVPVNMNSAICTEEFNDEHFGLIKEGEEVTIVNENPEGNEGNYLIQHNDHEGFAPSKSFQIAQCDITDIYQEIEIPDATVFNDTGLYIEDDTLTGSDLCTTRLQDLSQALEEKTQHIETLIHKLEEATDEEDISDLIPELSILIQYDAKLKI